MAETLRLFIGGLPKDIVEHDLIDRFGRYGKVLSVEVKSKNDATGEWVKSFAYVDITMEQNAFQKCRSQLNNTMWKGGRLNIQLAKQDAVDRYAEERQKRLEATVDTTEKSQISTSVMPTEIKGAVPGTLHPDNKNWVVTKYQRVVPVMNIRTKDKKKLIKYDPSKHCHQIKRLDGDKTSNVTSYPVVEEQPSIVQLTWGIEESHSEPRPGHQRWSSDEGDSDMEQPVSKKKKTLKPSKPKKSGRSAAEILEQEKAEKLLRFPDAYDEMEVVSTTARPESRVKKPNAAPNGVDLSRFDSESDSEPDAENVCIPTKKSHEQNGRLKTQIAATKKKRKMAASSPSGGDEEQESSKIVKLTKLNGEGKHVNSMKGNRAVNTESSHSVGDSNAVRSASDSDTALDAGAPSQSTLSAERCAGNSSSSSNSSSSDSESSDESKRKTCSVVASAAKSKSCTGKPTTPTGASTTAHDTDVPEEPAEEHKPSTTRPLPNPQVGESSTSTNGLTEKHVLSNTKHLEALKPMAEAESYQQKIKKSKKSGKAQRNLTSAEKHALSNTKRLEALKQMTEAQSYQQKIISQSLANLDDSTNTKKIRFDSDSEEEQPGTVANQTAQEVENTTPKSNLVLFDGDESSDDEEDEKAYDEMFAIKPQFEGEKGAKLLSLQQNYGHDSRFKLTEKFLDSSDSESDGEEISKPTTEDPSEEIDAAEERRRNLQILQSVVGSHKVKINHPTASNKKAKKVADTSSAVFRDASSVHYDPTDASQSHLVKPVSVPLPKKKKKKKPMIGSEPVVVGEKAPEVERSRFYEVAMDFTKPATDGDISNSGAIFSFFDDDGPGAKSKKTSHMNGEGNEDEHSSDNSSSKKGEVPTIQNGVANDTEVSSRRLRRFDDESSSDDSDDVGEVTADAEMQDAEKSAAEQQVDKVTNTLVDWFFFKPNDPRLEDGKRRFVRSMDDERLKKKWAMIRPRLVQDYVLKSKRAKIRGMSKKKSAVQKRFS